MVFYEDDTRKSHLFLHIFAASLENVRQRFEVNAERGEKCKKLREFMNLNNDITRKNWEFWAPSNN